MRLRHRGSPTFHTSRATSANAITMAPASTSVTRTTLRRPTSRKERSKELITVVALSGFPIQPGACRLSVASAGTVSEMYP